VHMDNPAAYICLGDSMSIDEYPYFDLQVSHPNITRSVGAGSLLFRNVPELWPEFNGRDIATLFPEARFVNLACDGATTFDYLNDEYLAFVKEFHTQFAIVTITLGGNDLLQVLHLGARDVKELQSKVEDILSRYDAVLNQLIQRMPRALVIASTIYDPTDGSGELPGVGDISEILPMLHATNSGIVESARKRDVLIVDTYKHFFGHGLSVSAEERWYWQNPIEPGAKGASELRRLWLDKLVDVGVIQT